MNYKILRDGPICSDIVLTTEEIDDYAVFRTFSEAKANLLKYLQDQKLNWKIAIDSVLKYKKSDIL